VYESPLRGKFPAQKLIERSQLMRVAAAILLCTALIISGCAGNKSIQDIDYNAEFEKGKTALAKKKYTKAQSLFNNVVIGASHTELGDDALFFLGESYYFSKEYLLAIAEYDRLIRRMPFSPFVEQSRYRICEAYVLLSPKYFQDQTYSEKALGKLQEFIDDYPNSKHQEKMQADIKKLRNKLSHKSYESAVLYIKMEEYKAALLALQQVTDLYYDTDYIDQAHLKKIECYIHRGEMDKAQEYFDAKRKHIENLKLADFVEKWFDQGRVLSQIEVE
jgi:outer membrane protein assembly factor BamD|tara:strand:+ start:16281 stop:17108 length:828 start_codon:yes stop_codon:yes gene_type:complete